MSNWNLDEREPHIDAPRRPPLEPGDMCEACYPQRVPAVTVDSLGWPLCAKHDQMV